MSVEIGGLPFGLKAGMSRSLAMKIIIEVPHADAQSTTSW